jgi:putative protease
MRSRSSYNFNVKVIKKVARICRLHGVKSYLTMNTIVYDEELREVEEILRVAKNAGITAVIASDMAVITMAHHMGMSVHVSVQSNVTNIEAVRFYAVYADVMVLARELNLKQIENIVKQINGINGNLPITGPSGNPVRIEIFTHGALCVSVSGKCYMSLAKYNTSANRGACYQNCRRSYRVIDEDDGSEMVIDNKFVMSPKDICLIRCLDRILNSGVQVLKLEGRGRSSDYVYTVTKAYREAIDAIKNGEYTPDRIDKWESELKTVFNRGFWHGGYYLGEESDMWSGVGENQASVKKIRVGFIRNYYAKVKAAEIELTDGSLETGRRILITGKTTGAIYSEVKEIRLDYKTVASAPKGSLISIPLEQKVRLGDELFVLRVQNSEFSNTRDNNKHPTSNIEAWT